MKYSALLFFLLAMSVQLPGQTRFIAEVYAVPDTICQGQYSQLSVTIDGGQGPFTYFWSPAASLSNPLSPNPQATPLVNTIYHLVVTDQLSDTAKDSVLVYVETVPPPPSAVYGPAEACSGSSCNYSINEFIGATSYSWTVPSGAVIQSGQNTPSIQLKWGNISGTVSVIIGNNCGTSIPSVLMVYVTPIPSAPPAIDGPSHICQSDTGNYSVDTVSHAFHYSWIVPGDAYILSGNGTPAVVVKWGISAGNISVSAENSCGTGPPVSKMVSLDSLPSSAGSIIGHDTVCLGHGNYIYSLTPLPDATSYGWTLPQGSVITSGQHTNRITVEFGIHAFPGPITAFGINSCGNGQASIKQIITKTCIGYEEYKNDQGISISPNPVSEKLFIHISGNETHYELVVFTLLGETVYHSSFVCQGRSNIHTIDAHGLPRGIMYLRLFNENVSFTTKFIVH
ncbi:MAG: T9SS type A sorting domain-containing protein [Bacteroidetes bacterium]|nr:T9SS type A sorting domain-containing protein [Bacteroidota bacterium]